VHLSLFDMFTIGIGPSSSHTVGPMRAARRFVESLDREGLIGRVAHVKAELFGSLGHTGKGHGSDVAVMLGLEGERPEALDPDTVPARIEAIRATKEVKLLGFAPVRFDPGSELVERGGQSLVFHRRQSLPAHPNGMRFTADLSDGEPFVRIYYSVGGGFVVNDGEVEPTLGERKPPPYPFTSGQDLLTITEDHGLSISTVVLENEKVLRPEAEVREGLDEGEAVVASGVFLIDSESRLRATSETGASGAHAGHGGH
jgi:L-serine dehydratase